MWSTILTWAKGRPLLAVISVCLCILVLASAVDGVSARRAAGRYFDLAKGWAAAYQRDTAASKKEYEAKIEQLTADRDAYRKKWEAARGKMGRPWDPPKGKKDLEVRFRALGYAGRVK